MVSNSDVVYIFKLLQLGSYDFRKDKDIFHLNALNNKTTPTTYKEIASQGAYSDYVTTSLPNFTEVLLIQFLNLCTIVMVPLYKYQG